jgi:hypothetical protein
MLVDSIRTILFLFMLALRIEVIISAIVSLPLFMNTIIRIYI